MCRLEEVSVFLRSPKLPVLIVEPGMVLAAGSTDQLMEALSEAVQRKGSGTTIALVDGDGRGFAFDSKQKVLLPSFPPRHVWTKRDIVDAYNATCANGEEHYRFSFANRRLELIDAEIALLVLSRSGKRPRGDPTG